MADLIDQIVAQEALISPREVRHCVVLHQDQLHELESDSAEDRFRQMRDMGIDPLNDQWAAAHWCQRTNGWQVCGSDGRLIAELEDQLPSRR